MNTREAQNGGKPMKPQIMWAIVAGDKIIPGTMSISESFTKLGLQNVKDTFPERECRIVKVQVSEVK